MSKLDAQRAMREARYEAAARATKSPKSTSPAKPRASRPAEAEPTSPDPSQLIAEDPEAGLCGHRSINGRTCTRESGHASKSHRYS